MRYKSHTYPDEPVHRFEALSQLKASFHPTAMMLITLINVDLGYSLPDQRAAGTEGNVHIKQCNYIFRIELHL